MRIYLSCYIRGIAPYTDVEENHRRNIQFADDLRLHILDLNIYNPSEHDEFVQIAYDMNFMDVSEILNVDCEIINRCHGVIFYCDTNHEDKCLLSAGQEVEMGHAIHNHKPFTMVGFDDPMDIVVGHIRSWSKRLERAAL